MCAVHLTRARVAATVRAEIARAGARRAEIATAAGLSYQALARRLSGDVAFDVDELAAVAQQLSIPVAQLLGEDAA